MAIPWGLVWLIHVVCIFLVAFSLPSGSTQSDKVMLGNINLYTVETTIILTVHHSNPVHKHTNSHKYPHISSPLHSPHLSSTTPSTPQSQEEDTHSPDSPHLAQRTQSASKGSRS